MICPVLLQCPDEFIPNTKVVRNRSTTPDTQPTRVSDVHDTPGLIFPPPDTLSGNHPERVLLLRMISRSEHRALYNVSSSISIHLSCHALIVIACCVFTVSPPLFSGRPRCYRRLHRCRVRLRRRRSYPYCRATRQAEPFPSPTYRLLICIYLLH